MKAGATVSAKVGRRASGALGWWLLRRFGRERFRRARVFADRRDDRVAFAFKVFAGLIGLLSTIVALIAVGSGLVISGVAGDAGTELRALVLSLTSALFDS